MLHSTENQRLSNSNFLECHHSRTSSSITPMSTCTTIVITLNPRQPQALPSRSPPLQQRCHSRPKMWSRFLSCRYPIVPLAVLSLVALCLQQPAVVQSRSISSSLSSIGQHPATEGKKILLHTDHARSSEGITITSGDSPLDMQRIPRRKRTSEFPDNPTLWVNKTIPFIFVEPLPRRYKRQIVKAMNLFNKNSCIRFVDKREEEFFVSFEQSDSSCSSQVGMATDRKGKQFVYLSVRCLKKRGLILHEVAHLVGLYHEHQRPDRDQYIEILYDNIQSSFVSQFKKYDYDTLGLEYDFSSIMHYPLMAFVTPGPMAGELNSMRILSNVTRTTPLDKIGQRHSLSPIDFKKVNILYSCPEDSTNNTYEISLPPEVHTVTDIPDYTLPMNPLQTDGTNNDTDNPRLTDHVHTDGNNDTISGDHIYSGEQIGLLMTGNIGDQVMLWLKCTQNECTLNTCLGKKLRENDRVRCPYSLFTLHKLSNNNTNIIRVGDEIILEHKSIMDEDGASMFNSSMYMSCDSGGHSCAISSNCSTDDMYNKTICLENILIVRIAGKQDGDCMIHGDSITLEFRSEYNNDRFAFGCDSVTNVCTRKICGRANSLLQECHHTDMFQIRKI